MKILFCLQTLSQARHFVTLLQEMRKRGDEVIILAVKTKPSRPNPHFLSHIRGLRYVGWPIGCSSFWAIHSDPFRMAQNAAFFTKDRFRGVTEIRSRVLRALDPVLKSTASGKNWGKTFLSAVEDLTPPRRDILDSIRNIKPDIILVSPLVNHLSGSQMDFVKAAHTLGIPVGLPTFSWDNFSSKGAMHVVPDRIFVWNQTQADELVNLHGIEKDKISAHGAWRFDEYRKLKPSVDYAEFCAANDFDPTKRTILYLGSSPLIAPREGVFASKWLDAVHAAANPVVGRANILIRAHPRNMDAWTHLLTKSKPERVTFQTTDTSSLFNEQDLFDTIHHCDACFAVNTSAVLEAAIQEKPVLSINHPDISDGQYGTLHFQYLTTVGGGLLHQAQSFEEHIADLTVFLVKPRNTPDVRSKAFIRSFLNNPNSNQEPTASLISAIDATAHISKKPTRRTTRQIIFGWTLRTIISIGLLPITPVVDPQIHSSPKNLAGRTYPATLRHPTTLPIFRWFWRSRFYPISSALNEILSNHRKPTFFEAIFMKELVRNFSSVRHSDILKKIEQKSKKAIKNSNDEKNLNFHKYQKKLSILKKYLKYKGARKYILEELITDLEKHFYLKSQKRK